MNPAGNDVMIYNARTGGGHSALSIANGLISWMGEHDDAPDARVIVDADGAWITPGLIDCHSHVVYGGNRANEFAMRLEGAGYEEIARAGGGIVSTVSKTRGASEEELLASALPRVDALMASGVTTLEIKSGYGLDTESECRMLRVARRIGVECPISICTSFLGAHAVPPEFKGKADKYIDLVVSEMLPAAVEEGLVDAVDAFCEGIAFSPDQVRRVFEKATELGVPVKLHAEQLSDLKGAVLAAEFGALSADHLEYMKADGIRAMARAGSVAVILPGAFYYLHESQKPPIQALRKAGVPMAVATDANPGSSPVFSMLTAMNMACVLFGLTTDEVLKGATEHAAAALGLSDRGRLAVGQRADLACWRVADLSELPYALGARPLVWSMAGGKIVEIMER